MSTTKAAAETRIQRLRASCDGCFLAKVKCSKARPICSRCLTCGTDCKYSPSSRAGKPKANRTNGRPKMSINIANPERISNLTLPSSFLFDPSTIKQASDGENEPIFTFDTNWPVKCASLHEGFSTSLSPTKTSFTGSSAMVDVQIAPPSAAGGLFDPSFTWNQSCSTVVNHAIGFVDASMMFQGSKSTAESTQLNQFSPSLGERKSTHYYPHSNSHSVCNTFDSSCSTPEFLNVTEASTSYCSHLKTCLESLFALHEHSGPATTQPAFDVVLTINRKAVEGCARMLSCSTCSSSTRSNTNSMLLATIMEKILSFYQDATRTYLQIGPESDAQMSIGTYQVTNEDGYWLKAEILWRELRKLEELLGQFSSACAGRSGLGHDETGVHSSLVNHLSQSLNFTFEVMKLQQNGFGSLQ